MKNISQIDFNALEPVTASKFTGGHISSLFNNLLPYVFVLAGLLVLFYLILAGYQMIFSGGDPKSLQSARTKAVNALMGFVIIFASYWITKAIAYILGLNVTLAPILGF